MALVNQTLKLEITPGGVPPKLHVTEYDENMQITAQLFQRGQYYEIPSGTTAKVEGTLAGHPFSADATVDGSNVTFELTKSMTAYAGRAWTKIKLTKDGKPVSTCGFWLECDRAGVEAGDVIGAPGFDEQIKDAVADYIEDSGLIIDSTLSRQGAAADAKAVGDRLSALSEEIVTTSESKVAAHNTGTDTHSDIRLLIQGLTDRLNALADSDDTTLDQMTEVVAYIKSNKSIIDAITTSKVSVSDIVNNLTTNVANKPLSAAQGVVIKTLIDALRNDKLDVAELTNAVNTALAQAKESGEFDGQDGKSAYQYAVDGGYTGTEEEFAAKMAAGITLTEADKAEIADMVDGATIVQAPKYVNSTTEMTDVNRPYVLISTGHIWANANVEIETTLTDTITATDDNPYHEGYRLGSDGTSDSMTAYATGYFLTPLIDLTKAEYQGKTIQLHLEGAHFASDTTYETWIQARVYGVDKSVLVNRYSVFADMTNDNNIAHHCNGTMSIAYNSETSATVTLSVPPTYGPSATPIGYIRFCAKGEVASSNITITYTGISTGVQWYDTGVTYGGGQDAQLAAKVAALNNEGSAPAEYNLLTPAVITYYDKPAYPDGDYSATNVVRSTLPYRADIPQPVTLKWQHNEDAVQTTISVNTSATVLSAGVKQHDATGYDNYPIYNLLPNKTYYYTVTHLLADGSLVTAKTGSFTTSNIPWRLLKVDGIQNVRDLGGWSGLNGQKVKYEKLFRGAALDDSTFPDLILTGRGRTELVSTLGIRADLDLRYSYTESAISKDMTFLCAGYGSYAQAITTAEYRTTFKTILEWIVARLSESHPKPVYFHCQGGCDRTGTLSFLLLGLLGVSESDLAREYELSSFSAIGAGRVRNSTVYGYSGMVTALKTYAGSILTEKFADFAETGCGVSADTITNFRNLMLE